MLRRALEEPLRRICANAGAEGSVIVEEVRKQGKGRGYDAAKGEYADMVERAYRSAQGDPLGARECRSIRR